MKLSWKTLGGWLISPVAIGVYLTLALAALTFPYYGLNAKRLRGENVLGVADVLYLAHQKSIDYRLRMRGPRKPSPDLALLTIDERAVNTVGRWPWPRATLAKALDNAFKDGAKMMAFDITFSEPTHNPATQVMEKLRELGKTEHDTLLTNLAPQLDQDDALGKTFATHADKIVAGSFYPYTLQSTLWPPETEFCRDLIFKRTPEAKGWDREEILMSAIDPFAPYMPAVLTQNFAGVLDEKEKAVREALGKPRNRNEEVLQAGKITAELHETCNTILDDFREELNGAWPEIVKQENPNEFNYPTYDAWLQYYRNSSKINSLVYADTWVRDTPIVAQGTKHTGFFNTEQDADGTIRSKLLVVRSGAQYFPSIALKAYLVVKGYNASPKLAYSDATMMKEISELEITNNETGDKVFDLPVDGQARQLLNYAGPQKMFPYLSFADLLSDSPEAEVEQRVWNAQSKKWELTSYKVKKSEFIKDKIFVVGATAMGIYDLRVTPYEENYPGAETHLNSIDNMIQRNFFRSLPNERVYMPLVLGIMGITLSIALAYLGAVSGLLLTLAFTLAIALVDYYYLFNHGIVVSIIWPLFLTGVIYVSMTFYRYLTEERGKKELRQTFSKYVSPAIVNEILSDPRNIELGGKKVHLTVSFSDVRGFTTISEKLDPRALSDLLNSYLTPMTDLVFQNKGTLDKYMGDAIMSFFGAPIPIPDHAKWACRCALQSVDKLFELQKEWEKKGLPQIDLGIGLNTGEVSVGNMGSQSVRSYTVMGDAVNLASRLEGINKQYGTRIILSEMTYQEAKDNFVCREVDWVRVKGKVLPVKIYELIAEEKVPNHQTAEMLKWFQEGYQHYHAKAWQDGLQCFAKALDRVPADSVSKLYLERCQDYLSEPPEDGWDGVFVMKTK
ncbi:MAG: adenylate/guanylate cyclase domain-containing protein [Bdellovibrionales bacterium]|nr:adenylate/guanylate cyclase domain-containing protein [Bdellovibrionales bacterium]